jgi:hypothetical protein
VLGGTTGHLSNPLGPAGAFFRLPADPVPADTESEHMTISFSERELATVLAALRHWQRELSEGDDVSISPEHFTDRVTPLTIAEVDELCQYLNYGAAA